MKKLLCVALCACSMMAAELGVFASVDEKSGEKTALWQIYERGGELFGKIIKLYGHSDDTVCEKCKSSYENFAYSGDASKMKLVGAELLYKLKKTADGKYEGGYIIDPKSGKLYRANAQISGDKLLLRGYLGISLLGRSQTWIKQN